MMVTGLALHCASDRLRGHAAAAASFGQFGGEFAVTYRHAIGDFGHQIPHFMLEWRAGGMQRRHLIRAGAFAGEIGGQPFAGYTEYVGFTIGFAIRIENGLVIPVAHHQSSRQSSVSPSPSEAIIIRPMGVSTVARISCRCVIPPLSRVEG